MKVILRQNVESLGKAGETIKVADGYARNYLIPKELAAEANTRNLKVFEHEKKRILQQAEKIHKLAEETAAKLGAVTCTIARRVGEQEKLFGAVGVKVDGIVEDQTPPSRRYDPAHPDAGADGFVSMPNVDAPEEMVNMLSASRAYQANLTAIGLIRELVAKALELGK